MKQDYAAIPLGVVLERRDIDNAWADHSWAPVAVIPGAPPVEAASEAEWTVLNRGEGWVHYHAGTLKLEMFGKETQGYKINLSDRPPRVYVVVRPGEEADEPDVVPVAVTVCPFEAQQHLDAGDDIVEGVPMPEGVLAWVQDFVARNHVDEPFKKRKRQPYDPRKGEFGAEPPPVMRPRPRRM